VPETCYALVIPAVESNELCNGLLHNLLTSISLGEYECPVVVCWDNVPQDTISYFEGEFSFVKSLPYFGEKNLNFARNSNRGLRFVHEQLGLGAFLVNMDVCLPHRIYLEQIINSGVSSPRQEHIDGASAIKVSRLNELARQICFRGQPSMKEKQRLPGFCLWISRNALSQIGYLDDLTFVASFEDDDYCIRACLAGLPCTKYEIPVHHELKDRALQLSTTNAYDLEQLVDHFHRFRRKWEIPFNIPREEFPRYILSHHHRTLSIDEKVYSTAMTEELDFAVSSANDPDRPDSLNSDAPIIRIYCGVNAQFSPEMINQAHKPIAGSELATMCMAREFARLGCRVVVYSGVDGIYDDVFYRKAQRFDHRRYSDVLISWRLPALFAKERPNAKLTVLWAHDAFFSLAVTDHSKNEIPQEWVDRIDKVVVLSSFHNRYIKDIYKNFAGKTWVSRNGLNQEEYLNKNVKKVPYRYLYSSDWSRGLEEILAIWPAIKEAIPAAELHVAYSIDLCCLQERRIAEIYVMLETMPGLYCHDRLGHQELADLQLSCEAWLYPPQGNSEDGGFLETYCISALEAQAAGCVPFSRLNGALAETVKGGIIWKKQFSAKDVIGILNGIHDDWNSNNMQQMLHNNRDWALSQTWESLAKEWLTELRILT